MKKKILMIDDEPGVVKLAKAQLEASQFEVITACDGMEGIVKAQNEKPDLIILDVMMPNLDGRGFISELKKYDEIKLTPIIIFTASPESLGVFKSEDVKHYLIKPYDGDLFLSKIREVLDDTPPIEYE